MVRTKMPVKISTNKRGITRMKKGEKQTPHQLPQIQETCTKKTCPYNTWLWKPVELSFAGFLQWVVLNYRYVKSQWVLLMDSCSVIGNSVPAHRDNITSLPRLHQNSSLKSAWVICEDVFSNLTMCAEGIGICRGLLKKEMSWQIPCLSSPRPR